jgi:predicted DNA-binding transcriptional regulator YafY
MGCMGKTERLYQIEMLIRSRNHASFAELLQTLEVSRATLWRDLEYLRSRLGAPIEYDRFVNGYRFGAAVGAARGQKHELPGLWFNERELYSLLMAHQLLSGLDTDGLLSRHLQPLLDRIHQMLGTVEGPQGAEALMKRVRILSPAKRPVPSRFFELVGEALLKRRRMHLRYLTRGRGEVGERDVSPQRLVHHRNTWYLDAWCHRVDALRRFALDAIEDAALLDTKARDVPMKTVQAEMDAGYGIYAGGTRQWAVLHFEPQAAQWISREEWHAEQQGRWLPDGRYELKLPYVDETELAMDLLRQGDEVTVAEPPSLRRAVQQRLERAAARYAG